MWLHLAVPLRHRFMHRQVHNHAALNKCVERKLPHQCNTRAAGQLPGQCQVGLDHRVGHPIPFEPGSCWIPGSYSHMWV